MDHSAFHSDQRRIADLLNEEPALIAAMPSLQGLIKAPADFCAENPLGGLALLVTRGNRCESVSLSDDAIRALARLGKQDALLLSAGAALTSQGRDALAELVRDWSRCPLTVTSTSTAARLAAGSRPARDGVTALRGLWWTAMAGDTIAPELVPTQGSGGALMPLIFARLLMTLARGGQEVDSSAGALARYAAARTTAPHVQRRLLAWAAIFAGAAGPDDAFTSAFIRFMALRQHDDVMTLITDEAASTSDPLVRCSLFFVAALLQFQRERRDIDAPACADRVLIDLLLEMRQAAMECGHAATAAANFSVHALLGLAVSGAGLRQDELQALAPGHPATAVLDPVSASEARSALVNGLAPHFDRSEDTPALIEQHSVLELVRNWSNARDQGHLSEIDATLAAMPERVRVHLEGISAGAPSRQQSLIQSRPIEPAALVPESDEIRLRQELLEALKGQSPSTFEPDLAPIVSAVARELLEEAPRDGIALRVIAHSSEIERQFETAIHFWERAARVTLDATERSGVYVRIAKLLADELGNLNGALENAIVAFICAPHSHDAVQILETRYRATGRYKDLHSVYVDAADAALERNEPERASDLLARRAQLEFQALKRPEAAAATLIRAIELAPDPTGLLALLRTHIAPVAGAVWVERAERAIADRPAPS